MSKMASLLLRMADDMNGMQRPAYRSVKELLVSPTWKYLHNPPERKHPDKPPQIIMRGEDDYKEHFEIAGTYNTRVELLAPFSRGNNRLLNQPKCPNTREAVFTVLAIFFLDVLLYYSEGFLPFLQIYYNEFYRKDHYNQSELEGDTTENLYTSLLVCLIVRSQLLYPKHYCFN